MLKLEKHVLETEHIMFISQADEKVLRSVFHHRKEELLSMQRFTTEVCTYPYSANHNCNRLHF